MLDQTVLGNRVPAVAQAPSAFLSAFSLSLDVTSLFTPSDKGETECGAQRPRAGGVEDQLLAQWGPTLHGTGPRGEHLEVGEELGGGWSHKPKVSATWRTERRPGKVHLRLEMGPQGLLRHRECTHAGA